MVRIAYIISHGHTARGAMQTGLLQKLSELGQIYVIAKPDAISSLKEELNNARLNIVAYSSKHHRLNQQLGILRGYVHQNIRKNPALWEKHMRRTRGKDQSTKRKILNHVFYYLGGLLRVAPGGKRLLSSIERKVNFQQEAFETVKSLNLDYVISTRPVDDMEVQILEASKRLNVKIVMYLLSWDNITSKGIFPVIGDFYLTWGSIMNNELKEYYKTPEEKMYKTGVTHFDIHHQVKHGDLEINGILDEIGLKQDHPFLFFTMSASYYAPNEIDIVEHLAGEIESNRYGNTMQLVIRPHMVNLMSDRSDLSWLERLKKLNSSRVKVDFPDSDNTLLTWYMAKNDMVRLSSFINQASICLNSGSTIAIEALYLDTPVIITAFDTKNWAYWHSARRLLDYVHLKKLFATGACTLVDSTDEMSEAILTELESPLKNQSVRQKAVDLECFKNDGKATERFIVNMNSIITKQKNQ